MHTEQDSHGVPTAERARHDQSPPPLGDRLTALFDKIWPHLAAWGLAGLLAFFAVKERLTLIETNTNTMLERIRALEEVDRQRAEELREFHRTTTEIHTMLGVLVKAEDERRAEERATWRQRGKQE
jgi:hypothetical protein